MATSGWAPDTSPDVLFSVRNGLPALSAPADERQRFAAYPLREIRIDGMSRRLAPGDVCGWISPAAPTSPGELAKLIVGGHVRVADLVSVRETKAGKASADGAPDPDGVAWIALITVREVRSRWSSRSLIPAETVVGYVHPGDVLSNQQIKALIEKKILRFDVSTSQTATI